MEMPDAATMQAMLSMASMAGSAPGVHDSMMPGMPHIDPNMAQFYLQQMAQYFATQQVPGIPPMPFPGLPNPYAPSMPTPEPAVSVSVEGMKFQYQLTEDDLMKVFSRYGSVKTIRVDEAGSSAIIHFGSFPDAQAAMNDLNGKVLNGLEGTLRINWLPSPHIPPSPYPGMPFPGWGFPPVAPTGHGWPGMPPAACAAPPAIAGAAARTMIASTSALEKSPGNKSQRKYTCRFIIGIENDKDFQVARRIIGAKGANMKRIVRQTEAKLRLRGVGSGYFEGAGQKESSEPLQLCISCTSAEGYKIAVRNVEDLLHRVYEEYKQFCRENGKEVPNPQINFTENQLVYNSRSSFGGSGAVLDDDDDQGFDSPGKDKRKGGGKGRVVSREPLMMNVGSIVERGEPGPNAPTVEEIEKFIDERNEARRANNFPEADRIRQLLHSRGVALMDEPGGRGRGTEVTTWRYWRD